MIWLDTLPHVTARALALVALAAAVQGFSCWAGYSLDPVDCGALVCLWRAARWVAEPWGQS